MDTKKLLHLWKLALLIAALSGLGASSLIRTVIPVFSVQMQVTKQADEPQQKPGRPPPKAVRKPVFNPFNPVHVILGGATLLGQMSGKAIGVQPRYRRSPLFFQDPRMLASFLPYINPFSRRMDENSEEFVFAERSMPSYTDLIMPVTKMENQMAIEGLMGGQSHGRMRQITGSDILQDSSPYEVMPVEGTSRLRRNAFRISKWIEDPADIDEEELEVPGQLILEEDD